VTGWNDLAGANAPLAAEIVFPIDLFCFWLRTALPTRATCTGARFGARGSHAGICGKAKTSLEAKSAKALWRCKPVLFRAVCRHSPQMNKKLSDQTGA